MQGGRHIRTANRRVCYGWYGRRLVHLKKTRLLVHEANLGMCWGVEDGDDQESRTTCAAMGTCGC